MAISRLSKAAINLTQRESTISTRLNMLAFLNTLCKLNIINSICLYNPNTEEGTNELRRANDA